MICFNENWIWNIESHEHSKVFHSHDFLQIFREFNFMILKSVFSVNWFHEKIFKLCKFGEYKQKKIMKQTPSKIQTWIHAPVWKSLLENPLSWPKISHAWFSQIDRTVFNLFKQRFGISKFNLTLRLRGCSSWVLS